MMPLDKETGDILTRVVGKALDGPAALFRVIAIAGLSVAETLIGLIHIGIATDLGRAKEALLQTMEEEAKQANAETQKRMAEATDAANRAGLRKRNDAIARTERRQREAEAAKTEAQADAIRQAAETERLKAIAEAKARLIDAIANLQREGGQVYFDSENLNDILRAGLPPEQDNDTPEPQSEDEDETEAEAVE